MNKLLLTDDELEFLTVILDEYEYSDDNFDLYKNTILRK